MTPRMRRQPRSGGEVPGNLLGQVGDQMMRNWDSEKYARRITKAKRSFPRS
jgi:hypothetical protein